MNVSAELTYDIFCKLYPEEGELVPQELASVISEKVANGRDLSDNFDLDASLNQFNMADAVQLFAHVAAIVASIATIVQTIKRAETKEKFYSKVIVELNKKDNSAIAKLGEDKVKVIVEHVIKD